MQYLGITLIEFNGGSGWGRKAELYPGRFPFFLLPGLGQFYNGDNLKGATMLIVAVGGSVMMFASEDPEVVGYGAIAYLADWIWSFIDAPIRSSAINRARGYSFVPANDIELSSVGLNPRLPQRELHHVKLAALTVKF